jgi:hypothetical protein
MKDPRLLPFLEFFEKQGVQFVDAKTGKPLREVLDEETGKRLSTSEQDRTVDD